MKLQVFAPLEWKISFGRYIAPAFYHLLALLWVAKGLVAWCVLLAVPLPLIARFENLDESDQIALIIFCVVDLVAGVALWLSIKWGGRVWLLACLAEISRQLALNSSASRYIALGLLLVIVLLFFARHDAEKRTSDTAG